MNAMRLRELIMEASEAGAKKALSHECKFTDDERVILHKVAKVGFRVEGFFIYLIALAIITPVTLLGVIITLFKLGVL